MQGAAEEALDRLMIMEVLSRYAFAYDDGDFAALAGLLTQDGSESGVNRPLDGEWGPFGGRDATVVALDGFRAAQAGPGRHCLSNFVFEELGSGRAVVRYYLIQMGVFDGQPLPVCFGWYRTSLQKNDGEWRVTLKHANVEAWRTAV